MDFVEISKAEWIAMFDDYQKKWQNIFTFTQICLSLDVSPIAITRALRGGAPFLGPTKLRLALASGMKLDLMLTLNCLSEKARQHWLVFLEVPHHKPIYTDAHSLLAEFRRIKDNLRADIKAAGSNSAKDALRHTLNEFLSIPGLSSIDPRQGMSARAAAGYLFREGRQPSPCTLLEWQGESHGIAFDKARYWGADYIKDPLSLMHEMLSGDSPRAITFTSVRMSTELMADVIDSVKKTGYSLNITVNHAINSLISSNEGSSEVYLDEAVSINRDCKISIRMPTKTLREIESLAEKANTTANTVYVQALRDQLISI